MRKLSPVRNPGLRRECNPRAPNAPPPAYRAPPLHAKVAALLHRSPGMLPTAPRLLLAACVPLFVAGAGASAAEPLLAVVTFELPISSGTRAQPAEATEPRAPSNKGEVANSAAPVADAPTVQFQVSPQKRAAAVPYYDLWLNHLAQLPPPERADEFLPRLREAFESEGVPPELVWLAETESSFNPRARSPAGARGLFQLMPDTARSLGLELRPDERIHPVRSARAAAAYLRYLHDRFGDWPLALAAYNAGESRVARELKRHGAEDFAAIAAHLPTETRFYVPRVLATVELRTGIAPENLGAPLVR